MKAAQHTYILTWNMDIDDFDVEDVRQNTSRLRDQAKSTDFRKSLMHPKISPSISWQPYASINNWQKAKEGDRFYLYLTTKDEHINNRIMASGFFADTPRRDKIWSTPNNINAFTVHIDFDTVLDPLHELTLLHQPTLELQFPDFDWSGETPDFMLDKQTAYLMEEKWYNYLSTESDKLQEQDFWCRSHESFMSMYSWKDSNGNYDMGQAMYYMSLLRSEIQLLKNSTI